MLNGATGEPLNGCEALVSCKLSTTGVVVIENMNGTSTDAFPTNPYPVGSELEIILTKPGFQRHVLQHVVSLDDMANRIDVRLLPLAVDTVGLVIEGDLSFMEDGIRQVVQGESVRIFTLNGVINVEVDQNGFFHKELTDKDLAGKDSLKVRAAYAGIRFEPQDIFISTKAHYKLANFQLVPKTELVTLEVEVKDSLIGNPLANAHLRIYQAGRLLAEGNTTVHGYYKTESRFSKLHDSLDIQVFREGYGGTAQSVPISNNKVIFELRSTHIKLYGTIADTKKALLQVQIKIDSTIVTTVQASESGNWEISIPRDRIAKAKTITVFVDDQNTSGEQQKLVAEILQENLVEFPAIDPKSRAAKWRSQINFGFGLGLDPINKPPLPPPFISFKYWSRYLYPNLDLMIGIRQIPNLLVGIGYQKMQILFNDTILVLGTTVQKMSADTIRQRYLSFNAKYLLGPRLIPGIKLVSGFAIAPRNYRIFAGLQLGLGKRTKLEFTAHYHFCRDTVTMYCFNLLGPVISILQEDFWIQRPLLFFTLIKKISW